jgi:hypothetical protein
LAIGEKVRTIRRLQSEASNATSRKRNMNQKKRRIGAATTFIAAQLAAASQVASVLQHRMLQAIAYPVTTPDQSLFSLSRATQLAIGGSFPVAFAPGRVDRLPQGEPPCVEV